MDILIAEPMASTTEFISKLKELMPGVRPWIWPDLPSSGEVRVVVAFRMPDDMLELPAGVEAIFCFGAGVGHLLEDPRVPETVRVARLLDEGQAEQMLDYVHHAVLGRLLEDQVSLMSQLDRSWNRPLVARRPRSDLRVTILGQGFIGRRIADGLNAAGFEIRRWTRGDCGPSTDVHRGYERLVPACEGSDVLVSVLPPNTGTENLLDAGLFSALELGAYVVNVGRGHHLNERDLLDALDSGQLGAAWLDVFRTEPLPASDPLWSHRKVRVTPHRSGLPTTDGSARALASFLDAVRFERRLPGLVR